MGSMPVSIQAFKMWKKWESLSQLYFLVAFTLKCVMFYGKLYSDYKELLFSARGNNREHRT